MVLSDEENGVSWDKYSAQLSFDVLIHHSLSQTVQRREVGSKVLKGGGSEKLGPSQQTVPLNAMRVCLDRYNSENH